MIDIYDPDPPHEWLGDYTERTGAITSDPNYKGNDMKRNCSCFVDIDGGRHLCCACALKKEAPIKSEELATDGKPNTDDRDKELIIAEHALMDATLEVDPPWAVAPQPVSYHSDWCDARRRFVRTGDEVYKEAMLKFVTAENPPLWADVNKPKPTPPHWSARPEFTRGVALGSSLGGMTCCLLFINAHVPFLLTVLSVVIWSLIITVANIRADRYKK